MSYLKDDVVINDPLFFDKLAWFHEKINHQFSLLPQVIKPSRECWQSLRVQHGNPAFLHYINKLPQHSAG